MLSCEVICREKRLNLGVGCRASHRIPTPLTDGNKALGVSSPAYPAFTVLDPRSITRALTSSAQVQARLWDSRREYAVAAYSH